ncbi:MAG: tRNA1(Val) (adenine(37)-N6)-methyltransferase [Candidatus Binataceae bacterium]
MLRVVQPRDGYRFSIDAVLLARFVRVSARDRVLELGAGCGVVAAILAALHQPREVVALEIQPELAAMAARNAELNGLGALTALCADLRVRHIDGITPATFDAVVANPPYRTLRSGRESPNPSRRLARGEGAATLTDFVAAAHRYATGGARVAFVFAAARSAELIGALRTRALEPKRIRFVHPRAGLPATTILVEARKGGGVEAAIEPPLFLYDTPGVYSTEARALLEGAT